jgi:hypothetical protein
MVLAAALLALVACSSSSSTSDTVGADVLGDVPADVPSDVASPDVRPDVPVVDIPHDPAPVDVADVPALDVPADVPVDTGPDIDFDAFPPPLTPEQLGFKAVEAPWTGQVIYFNTWGAGDGTDDGKDGIWMIRPEGGPWVARARAFSFWTFGVRSDGTIAFASADPLKDTHYPDLANLGNAIQNTYLWGPAADAVPTQISFGRVNDECHVFLPDGKTLLMCRRAKFYGVETPGGDPEIQWFNDPYRLVSLDTTTGMNTWLSPLNPVVNDLSAWPREDGTLLFTRFFADEMKSSLYSMGADGNSTLEVEDGNRAIVSPDGKVAWFNKAAKTWRADWNKLGAAVVVPIGNDKIVGDLTPSPDGTQIAYTVADQAHNCSDLYVAKVDGTEEELILQCSANANLFISGLRWVDTPTIE